MSAGIFINMHGAATGGHQTAPFCGTERCAAPAGTDCASLRSDSARVASRLRARAVGCRRPSGECLYLLNAMCPLIINGRVPPGHGAVPPQGGAKSGWNP